MRAPAGRPGYMARSEDADSSRLLEAQDYRGSGRTAFAERGAHRQEAVSQPQLITGRTAGLLLAAVLVIGGVAAMVLSAKPRGSAGPPGRASSSQPASPERDSESLFMRLHHPAHKPTDGATSSTPGEDDAVLVVKEPEGPPKSTEWRIVLGNSTHDPQLLLSVGGPLKPFQLRGFDYSPSSRCCGNNDRSAFQKAAYTRDIPRMAAMGANAIKLYGMCDGVLDKANLCAAPEPGCDQEAVTVAGVKAFLDFCHKHGIFVLLASRANPGDVSAYTHIASTYGAHPAVAGAILFDETLDLPHFNAAARELHNGFCKALGRDPETTPVEHNGRIISTAAQMQILQHDFQTKYGQYVNSWGFDLYALWTYEEYKLPGVPFKPYFLMESGLEGSGNAGCRDDCPPCDKCGECKQCTPCSCFADKWKSYAKWMSKVRVAGVFIFEWTSENWKGGPACKEVKTAADGGFNEANHGIFTLLDNGKLQAKEIGGGDTFESVLKAVWAVQPPGLGGLRGWL